MNLKSFTIVAIVFGSSNIGSIQVCPRATCTRYDMTSMKSKTPCQGGCMIGAPWSGKMLYCVPDPVEYPKYAKGC